MSFNAKRFGGASPTGDTPRKRRNKHAFWRDVPATPRQASFAFEPLKKRPNGRLTQADVIVSLLRKARAEGRALALCEIQETRIAQHSARLNELRRRGFVIENELNHAANRTTHSRYWLRFDPERDHQSREI